MLNRATGTQGSPSFLQQVVQYRELIYFLVWNDVISRYKQTILGPAWAVIEPVVSMIVFSIFFGRIGETEVEQMQVAYPVFLYAGLLPWTYFRSALTKGANSLVSNSSLLQKVYFPREIIVGVPLLSGLFDYAISFVILLVMMLGFQVPLRPRMLLIVPLLLGLTILILGLALILSAINARYRDIRQAIPYMIQVWMFASPVIYPPSFISGRWQMLFRLNPLTGYLEGFRSAIIGTHWNLEDLAISIVISVLALVVGLVYFQRAQAEIVDVI